jgi:hypothetical protein
MTDVMEILAAAKRDVSDEPLPAVDDVWRKLDGVAIPSGDRRRSLRTTRRGRERSLMRWATLGMAAVVAGAAVLVVGTTGGGPPNAFAGWSVTPTTPPAGQLASAEAACAQRMPVLASLVPTVVDARGPTSMLVYADSSTSVPTPRFPAGRPFTTVCITGVPAFGTSAGSGAADVPVDPGTILPGLHEEWKATDGQGFGSLDGRVGLGVTGLSLVLDDGTSLVATISGGWFAAWWPTRQGVQYAEVTTSSGTSQQPVYGPAGPAVPSATGSAASSAAPTADAARSTHRRADPTGREPRRCVRASAYCTRHRVRDGRRITIVGKCVRCS